MLLDEPFSSLDVETRSETREETMSILRASQVTTLVVTHDPAEAELIADEVTWLSCAEGNR
jgi:iron(III) transport system ATP-binding protein